jgi:hypothetical protein
MIACLFCSKNFKIMKYFKSVYIALLGCCVYDIHVPWAFKFSPCTSLLYFWAWVLFLCMLIFLKLHKMKLGAQDTVSFQRHWLTLGQMLSSLPSPPRCMSVSSDPSSQVAEKDGLHPTYLTVIWHSLLQAGKFYIAFCLSFALISILHPGYNTTTVVIL